MKKNNLTVWDMFTEIWPHRKQNMFLNGWISLKCVAFRNP